MRNRFANATTVRRTVLSTLGLAVLFTGNALADSTTQTATMNASASVANVCVISAADLSFGAYDPIVANASSDLNAQAALTITCTNGAATTITLDQGQNPNGSSSDAVPLRQLSDGNSHLLSYFLYQNNGRTTVWGNTSQTGASYTGTGVQTNSTTVFGKITAGQNSVPAGTYADVVTATITF